MQQSAKRLRQRFNDTSPALPSTVKRDFFTFFLYLEYVMQIRDEIIRSRVNPTIKWAASLLDKKGRDNAKSFVLDGEKLCY